THRTHTLSLHDALPICRADGGATLVQNPVRFTGFHHPDEVAAGDETVVSLVDRIHLHVAVSSGEHNGAHRCVHAGGVAAAGQNRSEEHTSELQSRENLV